MLEHALVDIMPLQAKGWPLELVIEMKTEFNNSKAFELYYSIVWYIYTNIIIIILYAHNIKKLLLL